MSEILYIRLGSIAADKVHWLIWSTGQQEIIASGELEDANALNSLHEKSQGRKVVALIPACDVALKSLKVPGKSERAIRLAAPYMLEDDLAQDVDKLFFAYANLTDNDEGHNCFVAAVEHEQIALWQSWLADANITTKVMVPDALLMPAAQFSSAIAFDQQILVKNGNWQGLVIDSESWPFVLQHWIAQNEDLVIDAYSTLPSLEGIDDVKSIEEKIQPQPEELPLALLAQHADKQTFNLLQGEYQSKETRSPVLSSWLLVAGVAAIALLLNLGIKSAHLYQLNAQQEEVEQQIVDSYKDAFPQSKRVRVSTVRSVLKQKLNELGENTDNEGFLSMLGKLKPAFTAVPELKPETLKFEGKRSEVRIQATANDYQAFERFKTALEKEKLQVSQGSQSNQGDGVAGSFSIKG